MKWSWRIARVAGIDVYIHATFWILIGFVLLSHWTQDRSLTLATAGALFTLALFGCVLLHEFGHALAAKRFGIKTRDITLLPIGGLARLERMPEEPTQELWVALAGPAVNVVIAAALAVTLWLAGTFVPVADISVTQGPFLERLLAVNVMLVLFNLLPAFPMDGGRVVRALLATRMEYARATQIAASLGQGMALLFGFAGLNGSPGLLFIAFFVWIGAAQEASMAQMKSALGGIPVSRAMIRDFQTLSPDDTLARAVELILLGSQQDFPVVRDGKVEGVLTRAILLVALARADPATPVSEIMHREFQVVDAAQMLDIAFARLQECQCHTLPVTARGQLVGLITSENVGEFLMIQAALTQRQRRLVPAAA